MRVRVEERAPGEFVLALDGDLDIATEPVLADAVAQLMGSGDVGAVVVDLAEVRFLDSSGMSALLRARAAATEGGAAFTIRRPRDHVAQVLRIASLDQLLGLDRAPSTPGDLRITPASGNTGQ